MKIIAKFLLAYYIIAFIGHDVMSQDDPPKGEFSIDEFNRWQKESQAKDHLDNQRLAQIRRDNFEFPKNAQIQYTIRMNRPGKYKLGEPIFICAYLKNTLDFTIHITSAPPVGLFSADKVTLVDGDGNDVSMTRAGKRLVEWVAKFDDPSYILSHPGAFHRFSYFNQDNILVTSPYTWETDQLESQAEMELPPGPIVLNYYFDMTRPGVYHLTFHRITFYNNKRYDEPLTSNTLMFEVLDEFVTPDDLRNPGEFNWPPPETTTALPATKPPDEAKPPAE